MFAENIAVFRVLRNRLSVRRLHLLCSLGAISLDVICVFLGGNMRHFGLQYAAYCFVICGILGTNMPQIASKLMVCEP